MAGLGGSAALPASSPLSPTFGDPNLTAPTVTSYLNPLRANLSSGRSLVVLSCPPPGPESVNSVSLLRLFPNL